MSKVKVFDLSKEIDKPSKEIVMYLREQGHDVKNHLSMIDDKEVKMVREKFAPGTLRKEPVKPERPADGAGQNRSQSGRTQGDRNTNGVRSQNRPNSGAVGTGNDSQGGAQENANNGAKPQEGGNSAAAGAVPARTQDRPQYTERPQSGERPANNDRPQNTRPQSGDRPQSGRPQNGERPQYNNNRPQNGDRPQYNNNRPQNGDRPQYNNNRPQNGERPQGSTRPQNGERPQGSSRPQNGDRPQYNNNRPQSGGRPQENSQGYRGQSDRGPANRTPGSYQGRTGSPQGSGQSGQNRYQGNSPRPAGQGNRPQGQAGSRPQGSRPQGDGRGGYGDRRPGTGTGAGRGQNRGDLAIPAAPKDDRIVKTSTTRDRDKEREREREKEKGRGERDRAKRTDRTRGTAGANDNFKNKKAKDPNRKGAFIKPEPIVKPAEPADGIRTVVLPEKLTLKELADKMKQAPAAVVKRLFLGGKMYSINQEITFEEAEEIALEYNCIAEPELKVDVIEELLKEEEEDLSLMERRPPVVCVMGHVDHGKTSLLDAVRETNVTSREAGGITQHIGAYVVEVNGQKITFLDTPGHEAFTSMRMRGAQSTDIAILVVAADDGVMPQTVEAISHAKAAGVEIIVAVNKIDKPSANIERVKQELVEHELIAEDWGGSTIFVPVSAHTKEGIDQLLEMILLTADVAEFKANPNRDARGVVIEAQLDKGRGPVATVLVQKGTLHVGDSIAIGSAFGKVRAMVDDKGRRVKEAGPSTPVEILGLNDVPGAGDIMMAFDTEKEARSVADTFISQGRMKLIDDTKAKLSLDGLFSQIQAGNIKELNLIIKADVQGSVEAVKQSLLKLSNEEVAIRVIHGAVGAINESDVSLASASNAIIIGFNVRPDAAAKETADREKVDVRQYRVIYNAIEDIEAAMKGMLDPIFEEKVIGHAEIRQVFKASGVGNIAGSYVLDGKIVRGCFARITRESEKIYEGTLASLKRFKDDVKEVAAGYECGLVFEKYSDVQELDIVELYVMEEVPR